MKKSKTREIVRVYDWNLLIDVLRFFECLRKDAHETYSLEVDGDREKLLLIKYY